MAIITRWLMPPRHLVRVAPQAPLGLGDADLGEQFDGAALPPGAAETRVGAQHLADLEPHREAGVQRRHRLLEDHGDVAPDDPAPRRLGQRAQVDAVEVQDIGLDRGGPGQEAHHGQHGDGLARSGLAHHRHDLARVDRQVDAVDGREGAAAGGEADAEVADVEQGHQERLILGSSASRNPSPARLMATTVTRMARPGRVTIQGSERMKLARVGQHGAPLGRRRLGAETQEAQRRRLQDGVGHAERRLDDEGGEAVRQHGDEGEAQAPHAGHAGRHHVILVEFPQRRSAHQPDEARQEHDRDGDDGVGEAGPQDRHRQDGEDEGGHRHDDVHQAGDQHVGEVVEGRRQAQHHADAEGDRHHGEADEQRHPRAVDQAGQDIPPRPVGAEREAPRAAVEGRRRLDGVAELLEGRMRRDQGREDGHEDNEQRNGGTRHGPRGSRGRRTTGRRRRTAGRGGSAPRRG